MVLRSQAGVAMVTVLFVGAALTAVSSAAAFVTVQQLRASSDDRRGSQSLAYAEAGVDRVMLEIRRGTLTWGDLRRAGCNPDTSDPDPDYVEFTGSFATPGSGYNTRFMVFNKDAPVVADRFPPAACSPERVDPKQTHIFLIESTGFQPAATRVVRQVVEVTALGLPVGLYAETNITCSGSPSMRDISLITRGTISRRDDCGQSGTDPYYTRDMFYGTPEPATPIPAAAHALGQITYGPQGQPKVEHRTGFEPNCEANSRGTAGQSLWDGSGTAVLNPITTGCPTWPGSAAPLDGGALPGVAADQRPPSSIFDNPARERVTPRPALERRDYDTLREAAKTLGIYCKTSASAGKLDCTKLNSPLPGVYDTLIDSGAPLVAGLPNVYVAFFDLGGSVSNITWKPGVSPCSDDRATHRSTVIVVKNGSINFSGGETLNGAVLAPEGTVATDGSYKVIGTIIARFISASGGGTGTNFSLNGCWVRNIPGPFLDVTPVRWSEVDR
jgi:hypothetical protein